MSSSLLLPIEHESYSTMHRTTGQRPPIPPLFQVKQTGLECYAPADLTRFNAWSPLSASSAPLYSQGAFSDATLQLGQYIDNLRSRPPTGVLVQDRSPSLDEQLFDATAAVKIQTSQVAMYLDPAWRENLFRQLDLLHNVEEWEGGDLPVQQESFATFLRAICQIKPKRRPGLGLSSAGHLVAAWVSGDDNRLIIEFLPADRVRWVITRHIGDDEERFVGNTRAIRLLESLNPYSPDYWFSHEDEARVKPARRTSRSQARPAQKASA